LKSVAFLPIKAIDEKKLKIQIIQSILRHGILYLERNEIFEPFFFPESNVGSNAMEFITIITIVTWT